MPAPTDDEIVDMMIRYGGGFVSRLGALYQWADPDNRQILKRAFAYYWAQYAELAILKANREA